MADFFTNIYSIKYYEKEDFVKNRFFNLTAETKKAQIKSWNMWRYVSSGQLIILSLWSFFIVYFSFKKFLNGQISICDLTFFIQPFDVYKSFI